MNNFEILPSNFVGMTVSQAARHHGLKLGLSDDLYGQANHAVNPAARAIYQMGNQWLREQYGGLDNLSMADFVWKYAANNLELTLMENIEENKFIMVLVTPFWEEFTPSSERPEK